MSTWNFKIFCSVLIAHHYISEVFLEVPTSDVKWPFVIMFVQS